MGLPERGAPDPLVLQLGQLGSQPLQLVGGKALNLGRLADAGFPVPAGFCLTTAAYRMAVPPELAALAACLTIWRPEQHAPARRRPPAVPAMRTRTAGPHRRRPHSGTMHSGTPHSTGWRSVPGSSWGRHPSRPRWRQPSGRPTRR